MKHLLEIMKIIEGAVNADRTKVASFTNQLVAKLDEDGDEKAAKSIRRILSRSKVSTLNAAKLESPQHVPVDSESRLGLADVIMPTQEHTQVILDKGMKNTVDEFLLYLSASDELFKEGVGVSPSLLLYGPPGCGKTELAKNIAEKLNLPLVTARTDSLISSYLGSTAKNIRNLFEYASGMPCVLFLDEFDAIAKLRDDKHELGELKRVVVSLLQNIDALDGKTVLIAATNHDHLLDTAVWRRFGYKIHVDFPNQDSREQLFDMYLGDYETEKMKKLFSQASEGLSGAEIKQLSDDAKRRAIINKESSVQTSNVLMQVLRLREPELINGNDFDVEIVKEIRNIDPKVFTIRRIAEIVGKSVGYVSKQLKSEG